MEPNKVCEGEKSRKVVKTTMDVKEEIILMHENGVRALVLALQYEAYSKIVNLYY